MYKGYAINRAFFEGDHWQDGDGWSGPMPKSTEVDFGTVKAEIEKAFISKNAIAECVRRHVSGVLGRDPTWKLATKDSLIKKPVAKAPFAALPPAPATQPPGAPANPTSPPNPAQPPSPPNAPAVPPAASSKPPTPPATNGKNQPHPPNDATPPQGAAPPVAVTPQDQARMDQEAALTTWWVQRKIHEILKEALEDALLNGYSTLRVFIPQGLLGPNYTLNLAKQDLPSALEYIYVHHPSPTQAGVVRNDDTMQEAGVYLFQDMEGVAHAEISYVMGIGHDKPTMVRQIEPPMQTAVIKPDGTPLTPILTTAAPNATPVLFENQIEIELGGLLPLYEIKIPILITEQVRSLQKMLNEALTMANRNIELAGFLERTILNGQMPGHYEDDTSDPLGKRKRFVPDPYQVGAAAINFVNGIPSYDAQGKIVGLTNPQIVYKDPVPPTTFEETKQMAYTGILEETRQVHYLLAAETYASGESRKQARADFFDSLVDTQGPVNNMIAWLLDCVLAHARWILKQPAVTDLRAIGDARINPGPATADTMKAAIDLHNAGGLSQPTMMEWSGVDDVAAELELIALDKSSGIVPPAQQAAQLQAQALQVHAQVAAQMPTGAPAQQNGGGPNGGGPTGNGRGGLQNPRQGVKPAKTGP